MLLFIMIDQAGLLERLMLSLNAVLMQLRYILEGKLVVCMDSYIILQYFAGHETVQRSSAGWTCYGYPDGHIRFELNCQSID